MSLLGQSPAKGHAVADHPRRRPAHALAPRLPALRPEDVLIQRDARGQKVLLGKGAFGEARRPRGWEHAASAPWETCSLLHLSITSNGFAAVIHDVLSVIIGDAREMCVAC